MSEAVAAEALRVLAGDDIAGQRVDNETRPAAGEQPAERAATASTAAAASAVAQTTVVVRLAQAAAIKAECAAALRAQAAAAALRDGEKER